MYIRCLCTCVCVRVCVKVESFVIVVALRKAGGREKKVKRQGRWGGGGEAVSLLVVDTLVPLQEAVRLWITTVAQPNTILLTEPLAVTPLVL